MSLPDAAEYWQDVKRHRGAFSGGPCFTHIKNIECGHFHKYESNDIDKIDCHACKKILKEDLILVGVLEFENEKEVLKNIKRQEHRQQQIIASNKQKALKNAKHGICKCGFPFEKRMNKQSREYFLGCGNYPKCKETKSLNQ